MTAKLYRGFDTKQEAGTLTNIWLASPRQPKDTIKNVHLSADAWFAENFGVAARSSTIICSTDIAQAQTYAKNGCLMDIIPNPPYTLIYSPYVRDFLSCTVETDASDSDVRSWLSDHDYVSTTDILTIPDNIKIEVMVYCRDFTGSIVKTC
ncbi:hypothetical protein [Burkholderia diffusa]|uniref:hypothetical protein n=1 Tax=Burkholderia diffusa TaxID=488732 RepID=UPI002AB1AA52|nr:hypothetical protein [Burkholderia diffusa]